MVSTIGVAKSPDSRLVRSISYRCLPGLWLRRYARLDDFISAVKIESDSLVRFGGMKTYEHEAHA